MDACVPPLGSGTGGVGGFSGPSQTAGILLRGSALAWSPGAVEPPGSASTRLITRGQSRPSSRPKINK